MGDDRARRLSSPYLAALTAGNSQLARWAANISAGLPSLRERAETVRSSPASVRCGCGAQHAPRRSPTAGRDGRTRRPCGRDCPTRRAGLSSISAADFSGKAAVRLLAADLVFRQQRADRAHEPAGEVRHAVRIDPPQSLARHRQRAKDRVASRARCRGAFRFMRLIASAIARVAYILRMISSETVPISRSCARNSR